MNPKVWDLIPNFLRPRPHAPPKRRPRSPTSARAKPPRALTLTGLDQPLEWRESGRTQRMTLKVDPSRGLIQVVVPVGTAEGEVRAFVSRHVEWVHTRVARLTPANPFVDGAMVPIFGLARRLTHDPAHRGAPRLEDDRLVVGGGVEFLTRRTRDHLIRLARGEIAPRAHAKAAQLERKVVAITLRDTRGRWGSCTAQGRLSFSWRLVMAPEWVLDYVVAHEVAHLVEMNHSRRFWTLCAGLTADAKRGREWLKLHGASLFRQGDVIR